MWSGRQIVPAAEMVYTTRAFSSFSSFSAPLAGLSSTFPDQARNDHSTTRA